MSETIPAVNPECLLVTSAVRKQSTRLARTKSPTRHRFKQYLFADPSLRLVRGRALKLSIDRVVAHVDELISRQDQGQLFVTTLDGRKVDLRKLKQGAAVEQTAEPAGPAPLPPRPPLDSIANDLPGGIDLPRHLGGPGQADPAAQRAASRIAGEKQKELDTKAPPPESMTQSAGAIPGETAEPAGPAPLPPAPSPGAQGTKEKEGSRQ